MHKLVAAYVYTTERSASWQQANGVPLSSALSVHCQGAVAQGYRVARGSTDWIHQLDMWAPRILISCSFLHRPPFCAVPVESCKCILLFAYF